MKNAAVQINLESSTPLCHILKNHSLHDTDLCISYKIQEYVKQEKDTRLELLVERR